MKKLFVLVCAFCLLAGAAVAEEIYAPGFANTGQLGTSTKPWGLITGEDVVATTTLELPPGASKVYVQSTTLTSAQVKALRATPQTIATAPGSGYMLQFLGATLVLDYSTNVFTESTDNLVIEYAGGQDITAAIETTSFIDASADTVAVIIPAAVATVAATGVDNDAIQLKNTGDGEIAGNASNASTLTIHCMYLLHPTGL